MDSAYTVSLSSVPWILIKLKTNLDTAPSLCIVLDGFELYRADSS